MSKHHVNCTKPTREVPVKSKKYGNKQLLSKPFCDCQQCLCNNCPDILKMLSITVTEKSCDFGSKVSKHKDKRTSLSDHDVEEISNLLSVVKNNEDCSCEVASRALRSNVRRNIGLPEQRTAVTIQDPEMDKTSNNCNLIEKK